MVLALVLLAPYDGLLEIVPHPFWLVAWKEGLVALAIALTALGHARRRSPIVPPAWLIPLALLGLVALASFVTGFGPQSLFGVKVLFTFAALAVALLFAPFESRDRDRFVSILMLNAVVTSVVGMGQQVIGGDFLNRLGYEYNETIRFSNGFLRSFATFNQPFAFGFYLMIVLVIGVAVSLEDRQRRRNRAFLALLPLLFGALIFTFVRTALLGTVAGLAILAFRRHRILLHALMPLPLIAAALLASGLGAPVLSSSSLFERVDRWTEQVAERSVLLQGEGIGSTGSVAERFASDSSSLDQAASYQPDNYYVKTLVELGPVGAWLFLWVVVGGYVVAHRIAGGANVDPGLAHGVAAATAAALVAGLAASYWEIFPADLLFWILLGVTPSLRQPSS